MNSFLFVHIPKTAGTSFRLGSDGFFGRDFVCKDYGPKSPSTSPLVKRWAGDAPDYWAFNKALIASNVRLVAGHFPAGKYTSLLGVEKTISFVRDPLQRLVSEYQHMVRNYGLAKSFPEFYRLPHNINRQFKLLGQANWPTFGFVGVTERYADSLRIINKKYGLDIRHTIENTGRSNISSHYDIESEAREELIQLNHKDIVLFELVKEQFDWRLKLENMASSFTRGALLRVDNGKLFGWALAEDSDDPVDIVIKVNGEIRSRLKAMQDRPMLRALGVGRGGFVGFSFDISKLKAGDKVDCVVANTGQPLVHSPWTVQGQT
ncbi:sulfotransferase family 2 domain-containing protein [Microbulbifer sp. ANSA003]|uniref:sulfotransferase family 2 domain-containing protein n=1 Tax=Microbulbifer sp. ANSA003 TaxID=3243360 RepID=UPI00404264B7